MKQAGYDVEVITAHNGQSKHTLEEDGLRIHYLPVHYQQSMPYLRRVAAFAYFVLQAIRCALQIPRLRLVYATSTPLSVGLIALFMHWFRRLPFVFEVRDLWPEAPIQMGVVKGKLYRKLLYGLERLIYSRAAHVVVLSSDMAGYIKDKLPQEKLSVVTNFSRLKDFSYHPQKAYQAPFKLIYAGSMGYSNHIHYLSAWINKSLELFGTRVEIHLAGGGLFEEELKQAIQLHARPQIHWHGFLNCKAMGRLYAEMDAALVCFLPLPILQTNSPNKLFDALASGCMILNNTHGWIKDLLEESGAGLSFSPAFQPDEVEQLQPLLHEPGKLKAYQFAARRLAEHRFSAQTNTQEIIEIVQKVLS